LFANDLNGFCAKIAKFVTVGGTSGRNLDDCLKMIVTKPIINKMLKKGALLFSKFDIHVAHSFEDKNKGKSQIAKSLVLYYDYQKQFPKSIGNYGICYQLST